MRLFGPNSGPLCIVYALRLSSPENSRASVNLRTANLSGTDTVPLLPRVDNGSTPRTLIGLADLSSLNFSDFSSTRMSDIKDMADPVSMSTS